MSTEGLKLHLLFRNDVSVRKVSTLVLGEMLKVLAEKYLNVNDVQNSDTCAKDIHVSISNLLSNFCFLCQGLFPTRLASALRFNQKLVNVF